MSEYECIFIPDNRHEVSSSVDIIYNLSSSATVVNPATATQMINRILVLLLEHAAGSTVESDLSSFSSNHS